MRVLTLVWLSVTVVNLTVWGIVAVTTGEAVYPNRFLPPRGNPLRTVALHTLIKTVLENRDLDEVRSAIAELDKKARDLYAKSIQAATKRYSANFAATYQRTTSDSALLDVTFDMKQKAARDARYAARKDRQKRR